MEHAKRTTAYKPIDLPTRHLFTNAASAIENRGISPHRQHKSRRSRSRDKHERKHRSVSRGGGPSTKHKPTPSPKHHSKDKKSSSHRRRTMSPMDISPERQTGPPISSKSTYAAKDDKHQKMKSFEHPNFNEPPMRRPYEVRGPSPKESRWGTSDEVIFKCY